jgi:hypothetical protein
MAKKGILKKLIVVFIGLIAVVGVGLFVVVLNLDSIIGGSIEKFGTAATGTGVTIEDVSLSIFSGNLSLDGLEVKNPKGFVNPHAFKFEKFAVDLDLASLASDTIVVNSIIIKDIRIAYEPSTGGSNLDRIQKNIEKYTGADKKQPEVEKAPEKAPEESEKEPAKQKNIIIKKFIIDGGEIAVASPMIGTGINVPMMKFEMNDIGTGGKSSVTEILNQIFDELLPAIAKSVSEGSIKGIKNIKSIKDIKGLGKTGGDLEKTTKEGFEKIKSLFSK